MHIKWVCLRSQIHFDSTAGALRAKLSFATSMFAAMNSIDLILNRNLMIALINRKMYKTIESFSKN